MKCAAENGRLEVVEYLLERRADLEAKDDVSDAMLQCEPKPTLDIHLFRYISTQILHCYVLHDMVTYQ